MEQPTMFTEDEKIQRLRNAPEINGKTYLESPEVEKHAIELIKKQAIETGEANIGYYLVYPNVTKKLAGRCKRCTKELRFFSGYDYLIQMSGDLWDCLTKKSRRILTWHELLHIEAEYDSKSGEWKYKIRDHDFEDFYDIYKVYGLEWLKTVKSEMGVISELEDGGESVKL